VKADSSKDIYLGSKKHGAATEGPAGAFAHLKMVLERHSLFTVLPMPAID
jgi:hypothetical protein